MVKSDYAKDIFKQMEELMIKCDNLSLEVKTIEKRTEGKFKKQIKEMNIVAINRLTNFVSCISHGQINI